jgi:hypothetical protein
MPEGIAGDQSPPGERIGPTFRDIYSFVEHVVRVGTRACEISTEAPWLLEMSLVDERARSRKRTNKASGEIESKDREIAACDLLGDIAAAALPKYPDEGPRAIGEADGYCNAPLKRRYLGAALARDMTNGKAWAQAYRKPTVHVIADVLYRLIYYPDTVADLALGEGGERQ